MLIEKAIAPPLSAMRPIKPVTSPTFPVYRDLAETLAHPVEQPDDTVAHTLAVAAGYAYSNADAVAMMLARMGLVDNHCLRVTMSVDAMFIQSTAHVIQSGDGSVVIVAYRGTELTNLVNWLTDLDVHPDKIASPLPGVTDHYVHAGFYRNVRATRFEVAAALERALDGRSVLGDDRGKKRPPMANPMTSLYLTGHSLGGAMAALLAVTLLADEDYAKRFGSVFKGAYTFGAPMVGSPAFAAACDDDPILGRDVVRYVYKRDPVPHIPPRDSDRFAHFGQERRYEGSFPWKDTSKDPIEQLGHLAALVEAPLAFVARQFRLTRGIPFQFSLNDHAPHHYISATTPKGVPNEFGDALLIPAT
jgi:Lipase (class 3)